MGGPGFQDLSSSRRSLYLMTARTGAKTSGFGSLFDRADCGAIVGKRSQSTVAPQALFLMNDPFTAKQANELAKRIQIDKSLNSRKKQIHRLYEIALGRPATMAEITISARVLQQATESSGADIAWQRLCLILLCTNEFIYID